MMMAAYVRRKRFEAEVLAVAVWDVLGKAMGDRGGRKAAPARTQGRRNVSGLQMLREVGAEV